MLLLQIRKTLCYAAQSLVEGRCPFWMGPDFARATSQVGAVVTCDRAPTPVFSITEATSFQPIARSAKEKVSPDVLRDAARTKIQKLEKALEVMGDAVGPAVDALKAELDKARQAAKVPPLSIQIAATQDFIKRSEKRLLDLEQERKAETCVVGGREGEVGPDGGRQSRTRSRRQCHCPSANVGPRDGSFEGQLSSVEEERDAAVRATACKRQATIRSTMSSDIPLMPMHVPRDLDDWMRDRNLDLQEALTVGNGARVSELISKLSAGAAQMSTLTGAGPMQLT